MEKKKQEEKMRRDQLNDTFLDLVEKQRLYFKTVRDFKEVSDQRNNFELFAVYLRLFKMYAKKIRKSLFVHKGS